MSKDQWFYLAGMVIVLLAALSVWVDWKRGR